MTIQVKDLLAGAQIADKEGKTTAELVEIIQRLTDALRNHEARIVALEP